MSTKIYYGIRFNAENLAEVKHICKHQIRPLCDEIILSMLSIEAKMSLVEEIAKEHSCEVSVGYLEPYFYGMVHGPCRISERVIDEVEGVREFGYWNNTDPPDELSEGEWEDREQTWNALLPGVGVPSEEMFVIKTSSPYYDLYWRMHPKLLTENQASEGEGD